MIWQEIVFTVGSFIFVFALVPSILSKNKPAFSSSITTAVVLTLFSLTYFTLSLTITSLATAGTAIAWYVLAFQKYKTKKRK